MVRVHAALFRVAPTRDNKIRKGEMIMAQKTGTVKWFSARRGYGFITDEKGNDFFAHFSEIQTEGFRKLKTGQAVTFRTEEDDQGRGLAKEIYPTDTEGDEELTDSEGMSEET